MGTRPGIHWYVSTLDCRSILKSRIALASLHMLGWVHRDISSGNLLIGNGQLKIADFEYAKKMTNPGDNVHDIRTVCSMFVLKTFSDGGF